MNKELENNATLSHYRIVSKIGKGGMGDVYLAQDTKLNRKVAIKFLSDEFSNDVDKLNRFVQEAQSASALNHPNIITVFEIDEAENTQYIALEYIEGETLTSHLKKKLKFNSALDIATQIASALDAAHSAGIVHRDIKPDNVMVRKDGLVKILDFGIAKLTEQKKPDIESEDKTAVQVNTTPGMIIGTANYMSPEQAKGKEVDARTDIFSFGVVLYEMITGHLPFDGESPLEIIGSILNKEPKPIDNVEVPAEVERIVSKTLRKDRNERYQTIKDLLIDLKDAKEDLEFQDKLDKTIQPNRDEQNTQVFKATTAAEAQQTTASGTNDSITIKKSGLGKALAAVGSFLIISAIGLGYWFYSDSSSKQIESIAVMPFVNESGDKDVEYLSDGMTETLIGSLSNIPNLSVKARSTVFYYKDKNKSPKEIGEELKVDAVLLGRINQKGEDLKISLELVDVKSLDAIWSQSYDRKMNDLVSLQSEIARNVSDNLQVKLTAADQEKVTKTSTSNSEAQQLYLKGRFHWNKRKIEDLEKAEEYFKRAIEKDPNYALAYTGLSDTYSTMPSYGAFKPREYMPKARRAANMALELDDELPEAHASLASVLLNYDFDWAGAEKEFRRAIELNPDYSDGHRRFSTMLSLRGSHDEAIREMSRALELDPLSLIINRSMAMYLHFAGKYDDAVKQVDKSLELFPDRSGEYVMKGEMYAQRGMNSEALQNYLTGFRLDKYIEPEAVQGLAQAAKQDGLVGLFKKKLEIDIRSDELASKSGGSKYFPSRDLAVDYARLKDKEETLKYLNRALEERAGNLLYIKVNRRYDFLRDDPRFEALIEKVGFPENK